MRNRLLLTGLIAGLIVGGFIFTTWLLTATSTRNPELSLYAQVTPPKSNTDTNFTFLLKGITPTNRAANSSSYTLTTTPQGTRIRIHIHFNSTDTRSVTINQLTTNKTSSPYPQVFNQIPTSTIKAQNLTVYIEYTAAGQWPFGTLPLYRDAYLFGPDFDSPVGFSTTETITLLYFLTAGSALPIAALVLALVIPEWRRALLAYFPWITFTLSFIMIWGLIFIGTPSDYQRSLGILPDIFSTIPHFSTDHLLGNLTRGFIISGVLLESWVGFAEQTVINRRLQLLASMILMDAGSTLLSFLGSSLSIAALQIGGFGASYTVEVWATLLMIIVLTRQDVLQRTSILHKLYPVFAGISGFALLNYVYEWFLAGFILGGGAATVALATNHIIAFFLGLPIIALFYGIAFLRRQIGLRGQANTPTLASG